MDKTIWIGSYTYTGESKGIYLVTLDTENGGLTLHQICSECENPSFLAKNGDRIYAVYELLDRGSIATYGVDCAGGLTLLHREDMPGGLMCHLLVWPEAKYLTATNYWTGSMVVCPIDEDGVVRTPVCVKQYAGKSVNPQRQEGPHTHSTCMDPSGTWLLCAELGLDRIYRYTFDPATGAIASGASGEYVQTPAGVGPRHFAFSREGKQVYVSAELSSEVLVYDFHRETGAMEFRQRISTLPEDFQGDNLAADIHCSADGQYLYVSNRGHDSIAVFTIQKDGSLRRRGNCACGGKGPRSFTVLKDGWVLIANQASGNVVSCRIEDDGLLGDIRSQLPVPQASYVLCED